MLTAWTKKNLENKNKNKGREETNHENPTVVSDLVMSLQDASTRSWLDEAYTVWKPKKAAHGLYAQQHFSLKESVLDSVVCFYMYFLCFGSNGHRL